MCVSVCVMCVDIRHTIHQLRWYMCVSVCVMCVDIRHTIHQLTLVSQPYINSIVIDPAKIKVCSVCCRVLQGVAGCCRVMIHVYGHSLDIVRHSLDINSHSLDTR